VSHGHSRRVAQRHDRRQQRRERPLSGRYAVKRSQAEATAELERLDRLLHSRSSQENA
jgi:hypothetical protein